MWRRILAYILFGLGFLTVTFFRRYSGELIPYPFLFWLLGLAMFWGGLLFLRYTPKSSDINAQKRIIETIKDLKANGEKIIVDLTKCELKGNSYNDSTFNNRSGTTEKFISRVINKDEITLSFYLDRQKQTTLYVDKTNRQKYYFDLDFLNS